MRTPALPSPIRRSVARFAAATALVAAAAGCPQCAGQQVGEGVARLTIRNVGAMATLVNDDTTCGFASDAVQQAATIQGSPGALGTLTLTVTDCAIDAGKSTDVSTDCNGDKTTASGKVTLSATRTVSGVVTGDPQNPIVPASADSLVITITSAKFDNFKVSKSTSTDKLTMVSGSISAAVSPRLAVAASNGACAIPTANTSFSDVIYASGSKVFVDTPDNQFDADVDASSLEAQNGVGAGGENTISGTITVFGSSVDATGDGALDPDYDAARFTASYACTDDFASPESFDCGDVTQQVADGAARLSIQMLGTIAGLADADTDCGFSSAAAQGTAVVDGDAGDSGAITTTVTACTLTFPDDTAGADDCTGNHALVSGSVTVTATKTVSGRLTGNADTPVVPDDDQPATFVFSAITVDGFKVASTANENALLARSGTLTGSVTPRTARSTADSAGAGSCSVLTPDAHFSTVTWSDADLQVSSASGSFGLVVSSASLNAVNGNFDASTNNLSGTVTVAGNVLSVPSDNAGLDPAFDQAAFDATWQCNPDIADTTDPFDAGGAQCKFVAPLAVGAAALSVQALGTVAGLVDADTTCGFTSAAVAGTPAFAGGEVGDDGVTATFTLPADGCVLDIPQAIVVSTDCLGRTTSVAGTITVRGTKAVTGFRTGDPLEPVVPTSTQPAVFDLSVDLEHFQVTTSPAGPAALDVHSGTLAGTVRPVVALDPASGACSVVTPHAAFTDLAWSSGDVTLISDGSRFNLDLAASGDTFSAINGQVGADENTLSGTVDVDGAAVTVGGPLDPGYDHDTFNSTFQCAGNGDPVLTDDAGCSFRTVLGNAAARLLVKAAGISASLLEANDTCGFSAAAVVGGATVDGIPPGAGSVTLSATADCANTFAADTAVAQSCDVDGDTNPDTVTHVSGDFTSTAATFDVAGFLTGDVANPVLPLDPGAGTLDLGGVHFDGFSFFDQSGADGSIAVQATLTGDVDGVVSPKTGRSEADSAAAATNTGGQVTDVFSRPTPVAGFTGLTATGVDMVIVQGAKTFHVTVGSAALDAFNGAFDVAGAGGQNSIQGDITVDDVAVTIAAGSPLVDPYDQAAFDASYACDPDLTAPLAP